MIARSIWSIGANRRVSSEMPKSPDAFRTISEVADDLDLPQHVLRFWETRFAQIKPLKRGGGRRYYRPDDVQLLRGIKHLLYGEGYTIKGVQRILREQGLRHVMGLWREDVSEPGSGEAAARGPEAYAPRAERGERGGEPLFEPGDEGPAAYAPSSAKAVTARRPNFEPILDEEEPQSDEGDAEEEELEEEDAELDTEEGEESEDEENEEEAEDEDTGAEAAASSLPRDKRRKLEALLRELTELRHVLDGRR